MSTTFLSQIESLSELESDLQRFHQLIQEPAARLALDLIAFEADHLALLPG